MHSPSDRVHYREPLRQIRKQLRTICSGNFSGGSPLSPQELNDLLDVPLSTCYSDVRRPFAKLCTDVTSQPLVQLRVLEEAAASATRQPRRDILSDTVKKEIVDFWLDDAYTTQDPGKKNVHVHKHPITQQSVKVGRRYYDVSIRHMYDMFRRAHPESSVSEWSFSKYMPTWLKPATLRNSDTCTCIKCSNARLALQALRSSRLRYALHRRKSSVDRIRKPSKLTVDVLMCRASRQIQGCPGCSGEETCTQHTGILFADLTSLSTTVRACMCPLSERDPGHQECLYGRCVTCGDRRAPSKCYRFNLTQCERGASHNEVEVKVEYFANEAVPSKRGTSKRQVLKTETMTPQQACPSPSPCPPPRAQL